MKTTNDALAIEARIRVKRTGQRLEDLAQEFARKHAEHLDSI